MTDAGTPRDDLASRLEARGKREVTSVVIAGGWTTNDTRIGKLFVPLSAEERDQVVRIIRAAEALYEQVEMAESTGEACLPTRAESMLLGAALRGEASE